MSHENTITIDQDGMYYNIPTVVEGKQLKSIDAINAFKEGKIQDFGGFSSVEDAVAAAKARSEAGGSQSPRQVVQNQQSGEWAYWDGKALAPVQGNVVQNEKTGRWAVWDGKNLTPVARQQAGQPESGPAVVERPSRGVMGAIKGDFSKGADTAAAGWDELLHPKSYARSLSGAPLGNIAAGTLEQIGAPITGAINELASRPLGNLARKLPVPDPETLGRQVEGMSDAALPLLVDPTLAGTPAAKLVEQGRNLASFLKPAAKVSPRVAEAEAALARAGIGSPEYFQAKEELAKATTATRNAVQNSLNPVEAVKSPDLLQAEAQTGRATGNTLEKMRAQIKADEEAASLQAQAGARRPQQAQARSIASDISPTQLGTVEAGQYGKKAFEVQKNIAEVPFKKEYTALENSYPNQVFSPDNALAKKAEMEGASQPLERSSRTAAERRAAEPIGLETGARLSDEELSSRVSDLVRAAGKIEAQTGRMPSWLEPSKLEQWANVKTSPEMTMGDLIRARRANGAAARGARNAGDLNLERQYLELKDAYHADIAAIDEGKAAQLTALDKKYATDFIPRYGFDSPAGTAARNVGEGEGFLPTIFKKATPGVTKDDLVTVRRAKEAFTPEDWNVLGRSFTEDLIGRSTNKAGEFDPQKLTRLVGQYRPETLKEIVGPAAHQNLQLFSNEMATSLKLEQSAKQAGVSAAESAKASKAAFEMERKAGQRYQALEEQRLQLTDQIQTERDAAAKSAYGAEKIANKRFQGEKTARSQAQEEAQAQLDQVKKELAAEKSNIFSKRVSTFGHYGGGFMALHSALQGNVAGMMEGAAAFFAGPAIARILSSDRAASLIRGTGRMVAGTPQAIIRSAEISAFLKNLENKEGGATDSSGAASPQ